MIDLLKLYTNFRCVKSQTNVKAGFIMHPFKNIESKSIVMAHWLYLTRWILSCLHIISTHICWKNTNPVMHPQQWWSVCGSSLGLDDECHQNLHDKTSSVCYSGKCLAYQSFHTLQVDLSLYTATNGSVCLVDQRRKVEMNVSTFWQVLIKLPCFSELKWWPPGGASVYISHNNGLVQGCKGWTRYIKQDMHFKKIMEYFIFENNYLEYNINCNKYHYLILTWNLNQITWRLNYTCKSETPVIID